jgi:hypothetical protein
LKWHITYVSLLGLTPLSYTSSWFPRLPISPDIFKQLFCDWGRRKAVFSTLCNADV